MFVKPKFWDKKIGLIAILLFPISLILIIIIFFKKIFTSVYKLNIPIVCVGNIYIGGTGKTPLSIYLAKEISKLGRRPVILRKYYSSHEDEYDLIRNNYENLIINKNRSNGVIQAEKSNFDTVIMDDGLQDYKIKKDLTIVCFNQNQLLGNGLVLPAGPLRETLNVFKNIDIVLINGDKNEKFEKKILKINKKLNIFYSSYKPINIDQFKNKKLLAVAGIGNPENFFSLLEKNNLTIEKRYIFPDHHKFSNNEIIKISKEAKENDYQIIMTEKDYFKIKNYNIENINYLKVKLEIKNQKEFMNKIKKTYD